jgi:hypothetical protein
MATLYTTTFLQKKGFIIDALVSACSKYEATKLKWRLTSLLSLESAKIPKFLYNFSILSVLILLDQISKLQYIIKMYFT